jgi:hypothetical protein
LKKAEQKKHKEKVTFKLCWAREKEEEAEEIEKEETFRITSVKPEMAGEK